MSGHIQDRWTTGTGTSRVRTARYGQGKRWAARWTDPDGRERRKAFDSKDAATAHLAQITIDMQRGSYIDPNAGKRTLTDFVEGEWLPGYTADPNTVQTTERNWRNHIKPALGAMPLGRIRATQLRAWMKGLENAGLALSTRHLLRSTLAGMLEAAVDAELLAANPLQARSTRLPGKVRVRVEPWSDAQVQAMWQAMPERYRVTVLLGAALGLRQGEILGLAVDDVDFLRRRVKVRRQVKRLSTKLVFSDPKFRKPREVPLPEQAALLLADHIRRFPPRAVTLPFGGLDGEPVTVRLLVSTPLGNAVNKNDLQRTWGKALDEAGIERDRTNGMHALRHHYASVYLTAGGDVRSLAEYLGHHDPGFTLRTYAHVMPDTADRMAKAVDARFGSTFAISDGPQTAQGPVSPTS